MLNSLPLFDFDAHRQAVLMPGHDGPFSFHEKAVFPFLRDEEILQFVEQNGGKQIGMFETITKTYPVYECRYQNELITVAQAPLGAPAAVQFLEFLIWFGVKQVISVGSCGVLTDIAEDRFLIPTIALRDEGTSFHYVLRSDVIALNPEVVASMEKGLTKNKLEFREVETWTTDGFFRETAALVRKRKQQGCTVVEMECAALAACAQFRSVQFGQLFFTADSLANLNQHQERDWGEGAHEQAIELAAQLVTELV